MVVFFSFSDCLFFFKIEKVESLVMDAVEKGATIVYGGKRNNNIERGLFYEPTLIVNIKPNMRLVQEEVMRVRIRIRTRLFSLNEMEDVV